MSFYFRTIPNFEYISPDENSSISDYIQIKNLFRKNKIRDDIIENLTYFTKYNIVGDERPDQIAEKFYGDVTLDWVILLANNIINVRNEWPLDSNSFNNYLESKYENIYDIHHYETREIRTSDGIVVLPESMKIQKDWKTNGNFIAANVKSISQISCNGEGLVTVTLNDGIKSLRFGNSINISNVNDSFYNGLFRVASVFIPFNDDIVTSFTYQLDVLPTNFTPTITGRETATLNINDGATVGNTFFFEYYDQGNLTRINSSLFLNSVSNYDYELNLNNKKREIYVLKPNYLGVILNDAEFYSSYKIGGEQYINEKLKRADNIKTG